MRQRYTQDKLHIYIYICIYIYTHLPKWCQQNPRWWIGTLQHFRIQKVTSQKVTIYLSQNAKLLYSHKAYRSEVSRVAETNLHFHVSPPIASRENVLMSEIVWATPLTSKNMSQMSNVHFFLFQLEWKDIKQTAETSKYSLVSYLEWGSDSMCALLLVLPQQKWKGGPSKDK